MDQADIEDLYRKFGPMVLRRARGILGDDQAARDAMQTVFVKAIDAASTFRGDASPVTWLYRMTTNHCLNIVRDSGRRAELLRQHNQAHPQSGEASAETKLTLQEILLKVPDELREIAVYYYLDQLKQEEIAEMLGVSRRTIGNRLEEFRAAVQALMTGEGT